jgi:hypothetical protein
LKSLISRPKTRAEAEFFVYDSEIATKSPARWRPLARIRGERASGRQMMRDVVVFGHGRGRSRGTRSGVTDGKENFSPRKALKNLQNGERISISRGADPSLRVPHRPPAGPLGCNVLLICRKCRPDFWPQNRCRLFSFSVHSFSSKINVVTVCFLLAKRSNPGRRRRAPTDCAAPRALTSRDVETVITRPVLQARRRTTSWRHGLLRCANKKQTVIILILLDEFRAEKER